MSKKQRQSSKLLEPKSFDVCKNATAPIIVMLNCSELNTKVSDTGIKTVESNNYREISRDNRDTNSILAAMWESKIFPQRWIEVYQPIYPVNQWIVSDKPVIFKNQRVGKIKQSDIEV